LSAWKLSRGRPGNLPAPVSSGISVPHRSLHATNWIVYHRDKRIYGTLDERNAWALRAMNSPDLLLGRTLIVTAVKPV
jgi:hypothetical protein